MYHQDVAGQHNVSAESATEFNTAHHHAVENKAVATSIVKIDLEQAIAAVAGERELLAELAVIFDEDLPGYLEQLDAKIQAGDPQAVYRALHKLKGVTAPFFADPVADQLASLMASTASGDLIAVSNSSDDLVANLNGLKATLSGHGLLKGK